MCKLSLDWSVLIQFLCLFVLYIITIVIDPEMKLTEEAKYEFRAKFPVECVSEDILVEVKNQIQKRATEMTSHIECLSTGTCSLDEPQIRGCDATGDRGHSRKRRRSRSLADEDSLNVKVSITYHGKFASLSAPGR